jgi:hypothetical protein
MCNLYKTRGLLIASELSGVADSNCIWQRYRWKELRWMNCRYQESVVWLLIVEYCNSLETQIKRTLWKILQWKVYWTTVVKHDFLPSRRVIISYGLLLSVQQISIYVQPIPNFVYKMPPKNIRLFIILFHKLLMKKIIHSRISEILVIIKVPSFTALARGRRKESVKVCVRNMQYQKGLHIINIWENKL